MMPAVAFDAHDTDELPVRQPRNGLSLALVRWRWLDGPRRAALAAALAILVAAITTLPEFGWLDATQMLVAIAAIRVIARAVDDDPHPLPFHDGTLLATAGFWTAMVTTINSLDGAELGTQALIFAACAVLAFCGLRIRAFEAFDWEE